MSLTARQQRFVNEYLVDLNATQAAIRAGYSAPTAGSAGSRMLKNAKVRAAIDAGTEKKGEALGLTAIKVLEKIADLSTKAETVGELATAMKGQELLGKHLKLFTDKLEMSGKLTLEQLVALAAAPKGTP